MSTFIALDFGGGSGRVIAGRIENDNLKLDEMHRFTNRQISIGHHLYWDFPALFEEMKEGLKKAACKYDDVCAIGIDTWGVDFGLVDKAGNLMGNPYCYRDSSTNGLPDELFGKMDISDHYSNIGIQPMSINTLFQLYGMKKENESWLNEASYLLFMPDLFAYYLTGVPGNEYSIASTSEMLDAKQRKWNNSLIQELGLPEHLFGKILKPGEVRGTLLPSIAEELGLPESVSVISVGSHDTASAVYAVPFQEDKRSVSAFLSSGTWSLLGVELDEPILTEEARIGGFTNEGGVEDKILFLQNITGLWFLQSLMRQWQKRGLCVDYNFLISEAEKVLDAAYIDVDAELFQHPTDMEEAIANYCKTNGFKVPVTQGEYVRCVLQSLAERYRIAIKKLNKLLPQPIERLHIIGGGCLNSLLNRLTEEKLGLPVIAGPVEATAIGNLLTQAVACGAIQHKSQIKNVISN